MKEMNNIFPLISYLFFLLFSISFQAQYTAIPDTNFEQALIDQGIDSEGILDNQILTFDVESVEDLVLDSLGIEDFTGIEAFTALEFLSCSSSSMETLDLSANINLETLYCSHNWNLSFINLDNCNKLKVLDAIYTGLSSLDLQDAIALEYLYMSGWGVGSAHLDIDLSHNPALLEVSIHDFFLESIDLSNNYLLEYLDVAQSYLSELDVSNCENLEFLFCFSNELSTLDVSNNLELKVLDCGGMSPEYPTNSFLELDLSNNINLTQLSCPGTLSESPYALDLSNNPNLTYLNVAYNYLSSLDIANGNNENLHLIAQYNPVECINVDSVEIAILANADENDWLEEDGVVYSADCANIGIDEEGYIEISVYPNPVSDILYLNLGSLSLHKVVLYNVLGEEMLISTDNEINMSTLSSGVYYVSVFVANKKSSTFHIIKE